MRRMAIAAVALGLGAAAALLFLAVSGPPKAGSATSAGPIWIETAWPFPMDQWGEGKAFACKAADCGSDLKLYVRAKIGFCSSTIGVADDSELERLSDFDFMKGAVARGGGHEIEVARMKGRLRTYAIAARSAATSIAYNNNSDAVVATVVADRAEPAAEPVIIAFLSGEPMQRWVSKTLGLETPGLE
jgi:hypothetical protein